MILLADLSPSLHAKLCGNVDKLLTAIGTIGVWLRLITKEKIMIREKNFIQGIFFILLMTGCSSVPQRLDTNLFYRNDLPFCVENYGCFEGTTVLPRMPQYKFELSPKGDASVDFFVATTCNRNRTFEPGDPGFIWGALEGFLKFFGKKKEGLKYLYVPLPGMEDDGDCPLILHTYEKEKGRHAWAFIRFEHPKYNLPATLYCDGDSRNFGGISICQAKAGLKQWASFPEPVMIQPGVTEKGNACDMPKKDETGNYVFRITKEECGYSVRGQSGRKHDMITIGYEGELIRETK